MDRDRRISLEFLDSFVDRSLRLMVFLHGQSDANDHLSKQR